MDQFEQIRELGMGSYGRALLVRKHVDNTLYVIKQMHLPYHLRVKSSTFTTEEFGSEESGIVHSPDDAKTVEMAYQEVQLLISLSHPNIVKAYESFPDGHYLNLVMDYCECGDLNQAILQQNGNLFPETQIRTWFSQLIFAVKYLHDRHILHRDVKAANIFLVNERRVIKLGDFGIAKTLDCTGALAYTQIGTPTSLSPELCDGLPYAEKAEVWALGIVLFQLAALILPFMENNLPTLFNAIKTKPIPPIPPQYSAELHNLIDWMLAKEPDERPTVNQLIADNFLVTAIAELVTKGAAVGTIAAAALESPLSRQSSSSSPSTTTTPASSPTTGVVANDDIATVNVRGALAVGDDLEQTISRIRKTTAIEDVFKEPLIAVIREEMLTAKTLISLGPEELANICPAKKKGLQMALGKLLVWLREEDATENGRLLKEAIDQNDCESLRRLAKSASNYMWFNRNIPQQRHLETPDSGSPPDYYRCETTTSSNIGDAIVDISTDGTALHYTCKLGQTDPLKVLLSLGCDLNTKNKYGDTPLHVAAYSGRLVAADILLRNKAPVNAIGQLGRTALHMSAASGYQNVVALLLQYHADTEILSSAEDMHQTPLLIASFFGHVGTVRILLDKGAKPTATNAAGDSALHIAAVQNKMEVVKLLIEHSAASSAANLLELCGFRGRTPLMAAAAFGRPDIVRYLLSKGANMRAKCGGNNGGDTALHLASYFGHLDVAKLLVDADPSSIDLRNDNEETALTKAAAHGQLAVVKFLLNRGASPLVRDKSNRTPLHCARLAAGLPSDGGQNHHQPPQQQGQAAALAVVQLLMQHRQNVGND